MSDIVNNNFCVNNFLKNLKLNKPYTDWLKNKILALDVKETLNKNNDIFVNRKLFTAPYFLSVTYIILITQKRTDTVMHITDSLGNLISSFNAHSVGSSGKTKRKARFNIIKKFAFLLTRRKNYLTFLFNRPIALHLKNVDPLIQSWLVKKLKKKLFIETVRFFYVIPFNGCRTKKIRRKKIRRKK